MRDPELEIGEVIRKIIIIIIDDNNNDDNPRDDEVEDANIIETGHQVAINLGTTAAKDAGRRHIEHDSTPRGRSRRNGNGTYSGRCMLLFR